MKRFLTTLSWDIRSQWRQGLYYAALFVVALWVLILTALPQEARDLILPFALFMDVSIFGFYFMAGILFLERGDGVLEALVVTPMPRAWYLLSKLVSLTLIAVAASVAIVLLVHGWADVNWLWLTVGTVINAWLLTLIGFALAARYDSITDFIFPSVIYMVPSQLPALDYFGIWQGWPIWLVPTQPAMVLLDGAFNGLQGWEIAYALGYGIAACAVVTWIALRSYDRFVVRKQGIVRSTTRSSRPAPPAVAEKQPAPEGSR